jgi:hypothetical protein
VPADTSVWADLVVVSPEAVELGKQHDRVAQAMLFSQVLFQGPVKTLSLPWVSGRPPRLYLSGPGNHLERS